MRRLDGGYPPLSWTRMGWLRCLKSLAVIYGLMFSVVGWADDLSLPTLVQRYVLSQLDHSKGEIMVRVRQPTYGHWPDQCQTPQLSLPQGNHWAARMLVAVQCSEGAEGEPGWTGLVSVEVTMTMDYYLLRHNLHQEDVVSADDLEVRRGHVTYSDTITQLSDAVGKALRQPLSAGQVLRSSALHEVYLVHRGQMLEVQVQGTGFHISTEGQALGDGASGQTVRIRTATGKVLTGVVLGNGTVQVMP